MGHLNKLQEDFDSKGLTVLSITGEGLDAVAPWAETLGAKYPILTKANSTGYSTGGVPQAYLIAADGTIAWAGHPGSIQDDDIEGFLADVEKSNRVSTWSFTLNKVLPNVPEKLASARKDLGKKKYGKALKKVETVLGKLEGEDKEHGETMRDFIAKIAEGPLESAAALTREGKAYDAFLIYEEIEELFKGHDLSKQAKAAGKALTKDKAHKLEIKAGQKLVEIKAEMRDERKPEDKLACLKPLLAKKYAETFAGKEAAKLAERLK